MVNFIGKISNVYINIMRTQPRQCGLRYKIYICKDCIVIIIIIIIIIIITIIQTCRSGIQLAHKP